MKALSIRQPWAWLIVNGHKDIENRDWPTTQRGPILIHASKGCTSEEYKDAVSFAKPLLPKDVVIPPLENLPRGGICGSVDILCCTKNSYSPWFVGPHGFVLTNPQVLDFVPIKGRLGFFNVPFSTWRQKHE